MAVARTSPGHRTAGVALALLRRQDDRAALLATDRADGSISGLWTPRVLATLAIHRCSTRQTGDLAGLRNGAAQRRLAVGSCRRCVSTCFCCSACCAPPSAI